LIEKLLHPSRGLKIPGAHEGAERRIDREGAVAAAAQPRRQSARHATGGDLRHVIGEAPERARGKACEHVVLGIPAWTARPFADEVAALAVEGTEVVAVTGSDLHAAQGADGEARLIVHQDDVRRLSRGRADAVPER